MLPRMTVGTNRSEFAGGHRHVLRTYPVSDLSDFVNLDFDGDTPIFKPKPPAPPVEKVQHVAFRWPTPPVAAYPDALEQSQAQRCEFVGVNGKKVNGRLIFFVPDDFVAHVQVPPARTTMPLRFSQFRSLRVLDPLQPVREPRADPAADMLEQRPATPYRIVLPGGGELEGDTIGHVENAHGLFLFPPVDADKAYDVIDVMREGYLIGDDTLRPAGVAVGKRAG